MRLWWMSAIILLPTLVWAHPPAEHEAPDYFFNPKGTAPQTHRARVGVKIGPTQPKPCAPSADCQAARPAAPVRTPAKVIRRVNPQYPAAAKAANVQGKIKAAVHIERDGSVKSVKVVRGLVPDLDAAAISALKKWRFKPATLDGKPIASKRRIVVEFRIEE